MDTKTQTFEEYQEVYRKKIQYYEEKIANSYYDKNEEKSILIDSPDKQFMSPVNFGNLLGGGSGALKNKEESFEK